MGDYSVVISAIVLLTVVGLLKYFPRSRRDRTGSAASPAADQAGELLDGVQEFPPHGQVLVLSSQGARVKPNAVWEKLSPYSDGRMPYVGLIVDFNRVEYEFSSADLGGVASAIAAWVRGWVAPCAIVMQGSGARRLQQLLAITKLDAIDELRIVDSADLGRVHVERHLAQRAV